MGLWDWLTGKPNRVTVFDRIWLTRPVKLQKLCQELREHVAVAQPVIMLAHFAATLAEIRQVLTGAGIPHKLRTGRISARDISPLAKGGSENLVYLGLVKQLDSDPSRTQDVDEPGVIHFLLTERHFFRKYDDLITDFAESLSIRSDVTFHLSLEDPLMTVFAGEWVKGVLQKLGIDESSAIQSPMIAKRVRGAQASIAKRAEEVGDAESAEEWIRAQSNLNLWRSGS
jgi:preprotein translocase subunit SecA